MTPLVQFAALAAVAVGAIAFAIFVARMLWKLMTGEAGRLETARRVQETAAIKDAAEVE